MTTPGQLSPYCSSGDATAWFITWDTFPGICLLAIFFPLPKLKPQRLTFGHENNCQGYYPPPPPPPPPPPLPALQPLPSEARAEPGDYEIKRGGVREG